MKNLMILKGVYMMKRTLPEIAIALIVVRPGSAQTQLVLVDNT